MSTVAVPDVVSRLAAGFADAAPGHRFLLYLPMWSANDWGLVSGAKTAAAKAATHLPDKVRALSQALRVRQQGLAKAQGALSLLAKSTAPFATGLGNEHPIENGFAFLTPYGLPYLAGSGVKGVLRRAMQDLRDEHQAGFTDEVIEALFGVEVVKEPEDARRGALDFWDCLPEGPLEVDIMTPHYSGYYQQSNGKSQTPHDAGQPTPIPFLTVAPGAAFDFHVVCHQARLPLALRGAPWRALLIQSFEHAFDWLGFGAKTAVGYGAMKPDVERSRVAERQLADDLAKQQVKAQQDARAKEKTRMSPSQKAMAELFDARVDKNQDERAVFFAALKAGKLAEYRLDVASLLKRLMQEQKRWKESTEKKNPDKDTAFQDTLLVKKWLLP
ncbi:type III-B CRISPR module RAMP protein Cmr6 [Roseateles sp. GG27B]